MKQGEAALKSDLRELKLTLGECRQLINQLGLLEASNMGRHETLMLSFKRARRLQMALRFHPLTVSYTVCAPWGPCGVHRGAHFAHFFCFWFLLFPNLNAMVRDYERVTTLSRVHVLMSQNE